MNKLLYKKTEEKLEGSKFEIVIDKNDTILIQDKSTNIDNGKIQGTYLIFQKGEFTPIELKEQLLTEKKDYEIESLMNESPGKFSYKNSVKLNKDYNSLFNLLYPIVDRKEKINSILDEND
jgi:hypothetical protein